MKKETTILVHKNGNITSNYHDVLINLKKFKKNDILYNNNGMPESMLYDLIELNAVNLYIFKEL